MENLRRLGANIKDLQLEFAILNRIRDEVCNKGAPLNDERAREAFKMVDIQKEYEELQGGLNPDQLNGTLKLNMQVIESLKAVKVLKQSTVDTFLHEIPGDKLKRFSHDDLDSITSKFSVPIGSGGFGKVYRGQFLNGGLHVAVKVLIQSEVIEEIFMIEVNTMLKASHPNIIKLYGFCFDSKTKALIYEYMKTGSLDKIVYKKPLSIKWEKLYDIATETAKALAYLHHGCDDQVIHHDLKPANVLLDTNFSPKLTDFGTARILSRDVRSFTMSKIRGTCGYTAPEMVLYSSRVTYTCDVYSFGMMLFDFLGMRNDIKRESLLPGEVWKKVRNGELDETIREFGISENDKEKARVLSVVALWCVQFTPRIRPSMTDVVDALEKESGVTMPPDPSFSWDRDVSMQQSSGMNYSSAFPSKDKRFLAGRPKTKYGARHQRKESSQVLPRSTLERFSDGDLQSFTNNFSTIVDSDEFGDIYKGEFTNGMQVAVRVLAEMDITEDIFVSEVSTMAMTYHPNIIKLYGYCFDGNMKAFVHENMGSMSLHKVLHGNHLNVEWEQLYGIAIETANVITYLHDGHCKRIIHCNVKPGNVLLDSYNTPKLKNFELVKFLSKNEKYLNLTRHRGPPGYTAPEMCTSTSQVTSKCDVYSFGIMLFEILGMRRNNLNQVWFPREVWKRFRNGHLDRLINECSISQEDGEKARVLAKLALWCIQFTPHIRPSMRSVVNILENEIQVATPPNPFLPSDLELLMQPSREAIYLIFSPYVDERLLENKLWEGLTNPIPVQFSRRPHTNTSIEMTPDHSLSKESTEHIKKESIEMTLSELPTFTLKQFSREDIQSFTENFSIRFSVDASGHVFEGRFPNGLQVLVKVLRDMDHSDELFMNEMRNIDHPNIVKLYGYCDEDNMKALVHEYVKLTLDVILSDKHFEIEWEQLYGITVDTAKALSHLHNDCHEQIIHFDVKPGVVMVDSNFSPKITNFELPKLMNNSHPTWVWNGRGTRGYAAPEMWDDFAQITSKSDVYSFGMLLFEVLGRRLNNTNRKWFPKLIWELFEKREIEEIMKECQIAEKNREKAMILCMVGFWCIQFTPKARPSMNTVVNTLENEIQVTEPPEPFLPSMRACSMKPSQEAIWSTVSPAIHRENQGKGVSFKKKRHSSANTSKDGQGSVKCFFCHKKGHMKKDCIKYKNWLEKKGNMSFVTFECNFINVPLFSWWIDSGATVHIANNMQDFQNQRKPTERE